MLSPHDRVVLDYLRRQAVDRLIASLPTAELRVLAALAQEQPSAPLLRNRT